MTHANRLQSQLWVVAQFLVFLLLCIWQVPGTIALRNVLLGCLSLLAVVLCYTSKNGVYFVRLLMQPAIVCLVFLTGWFLLSLSWASEPQLSAVELKGQWLMPVLCGLTGGLLATAATSAGRDAFRSLVQVVFWALAVQVLLHDLLDLMFWLGTGGVPFRQAPVLYLPEIIKSFCSGHPLTGAFTGQSGDKFSYVNNTLAALVVAELFQRILLKKPWLSVSWPALLIVTAAILGCTYLLQFRNGNVGLLLLMLFAVFMVLVRLVRQWPIWKSTTIAVVSLAILVAFGAMLYQSDQRWPSFAETVSIALDTENYQTWRNPSVAYPALRNGATVDASAYLRVAWGKEGLKLVADHPLGTGFNRNAFGDGIDAKYQMNGAYRGGHAHSGLIDFAIANGLPGLMLWLAFLGVLFYTGWAAFVRGQIAPALALMFIVSGFFSRSIVDSNIRDHMLQQFMFLSIFFAVALNTASKMGGADG